MGRVNFSKKKNSPNWWMNRNVETIIFWKMRRSQLTRAAGIGTEPVEWMKTYGGHFEFDKANGANQLLFIIKFFLKKKFRGKKIRGRNGGWTEGGDPGTVRKRPIMTGHPIDPFPTDDVTQWSLKWITTPFIRIFMIFVDHKSPRWDLWHPSPTGGTWRQSTGNVF